MILWLASYPRSGNTLLRTILFRSFDLKTYSKYNDASDIGSSQEIAEKVGHLNYEGDWGAFYRLARASEELIPIKTHDAPTDQGKAIYVVRNAAASVISFFHYLQNYSNYKADICDVISGSVSFGGWSQHYLRWSPKTRPDTLFLAFEELIGDTAVAIRKIAGFIDREPTGFGLPDFMEMRSASKKFFRSGSNASNQSELSDRELSLLYFCHGDVMGELGYRDDITIDYSGVRALLDEQSEKLRKFRISPLTGIAARLNDLGGPVMTMRATQASDSERITEIAANLIDLAGLVKTMRATQASDSERIIKAEFAGRKSFEYMKENARQLEALQLTIAAKNRKIIEQRSALQRRETELVYAAQATERSAMQLSALKAELSALKAKISEQEARLSNQGEKIEQFEYVLEPRLKSILEMRAIRHVMRERRKKKAEFRNFQS